MTHPKGKHGSARPHQAKGREAAPRPAKPLESMGEGPERPARQEEQIIFGLRACLALFDHRPQAILRVYYTAPNAKALAQLLKWAASRRLPYRELDMEAMGKVTGATHHEGVALAASPLRLLDGEQIPKPKRLLLALDGVENPFNQGALIRSAAFFGVEGVILGGATPGAKVNAAALRASEGGAEAVPLYAAPRLEQTLERLNKMRVHVVGLETGGGQPLEEAQWKPPLVLVAGHEQEGLSRAVLAACTRLTEISGSGQVDSLNVSVAVGIALARLSGMG